MKTKIISFTLAAVMTVTTVGVFAGSHDPRIRLEQMGESVLHLYMDSLDQTAKFTIYDAGRYALYSETSEQLMDYRKRFDLSKLPEGRYTFEIEHGKKIKIYAFTVEDNHVEISDKIAEVYKPTILFEDDLLGISLLNPNAKDVTITLVDANGRSLITEKMEEKQMVAIRYNLSQLPMGNYQVVVKTDGRTYLHDLDL